MGNTESSAFTALCDHDGTVVEVLDNELAYQLIAGHHLGDLVQVHSRWKIEQFLKTILGRGAALNWELDVEFRGGVVPLFFSGCRTNSGISLIGSNTLRLAEELGGELMRMIGKKPKRASGGEPKSGTALNQLVRLGDELLVAQLEVVKKNLDLEKQKVETFQELEMAVHGLRNPTSGILSAVEYLIEDAAKLLPENYVALLQGVVRSTSFMLRMIDDVMDISSMEGGKLRVDRRPTDLVTLVTNTLLLNERQWHRREIQVDTSFEQPALILDLDPIKMMQVIDNLVSNAIKFSHRGGRIEVKIGVQVHNVVSVSVRDEGPGISADQLNTMFDPFKNRSTGHGFLKTGTGLGLAISRRIVEQHAGTIDVKSELGNGSMFTVNLPVAADAQASSHMESWKLPRKGVGPQNGSAKHKAMSA